MNEDQDHSVFRPGEFLVSTQYNKKVSKMSEQELWEELAKLIKRAAHMTRPSPRRQGLVHRRKRLLQ